MKSEDKYLLTITGSDGTGESGIEADIRTIEELGDCSLLTAVTSVTVQSSLGIQSYYDLPAKVVGAQVETLLSDYAPRVIKVGMMRGRDTVVTLANLIGRYQPEWLVYDLSVHSAREDNLTSSDILDDIQQRFFPLVSLLVIKKKDAETILRQRIESNDGLQEAASRFLRAGCKAVLICDCQIIDGGCSDYSLTSEGDERFWTLPKSARNVLHGKGNRLSSAIAYYLCQGKSLGQAIEGAEDYLHRFISRYREMQTRSDELYGRFLGDVAKLYKEQRDVQSYASRLQVSPRYLAQLTHKMAGCSPKEIIERQLWAEIQDKLSTSTLTIQEIAYALGFSSQGQLTRFVRKRTGKTPSQFR